MRKGTIAEDTLEAMALDKAEWKKWIAQPSCQDKAHLGSRQKKNN